MKPIAYFVMRKGSCASLPAHLSNIQLDKSRFFKQVGVNIVWLHTHFVLDTPSVGLCWSVSEWA